MKIFREKSFEKRFILVCMLACWFLQSAFAGDPVAGEKVFQKCQACHEIVADKNKVGPSLHGVIGRQAGASASFTSYSEALKNSDIVWSEEVMKAFLHSPMTYIKGTRMFFTGIKSDQELDDLIAYIKASSQ